MAKLPSELWLTFEDGLHVGVFKDPAAADKLNELRRSKRNVSPVTARYVLADETHFCVECGGEVLDAPKAR